MTVVSLQDLSPTSHGTILCGRNIPTLTIIMDYVLFNRTFLLMIYCCYVLIVPICYIHIYKFRKDYKTPGNNQQQLIEMR